MAVDRTTADKVGTPNADPLTGEPGAHPVGVGVGGVAGGVLAGAVAGTVAGPVGTAIGAAAGAIAGAFAGKSMAEGIDPTVENAYWRDNYATREYANGRGYDDFGPAYRHAFTFYQPGRAFEDVEPEMADTWMGARDTSSLGWGDASSAARDAWNRLDEKGRPLD